MPRFFFHTNHADVHIVDEEGALMSDVNAAEMEAAAVLTQLAQDGLDRKRVSPIAIQVVDHDGRPVFEASVNFRKLC